MKESWNSGQQNGFGKSGAGKYFQTHRRNESKPHAHYYYWEKNDAVLLSLDDWNAIQETLYLTSIPGMRESIVEGLKTPLDACETYEW